MYSQSPILYISGVLIPIGPLLDIHILYFSGVVTGDDRAMVIPIGPSVNVHVFPSFISQVV